MSLSESIDEKVEAAIVYAHDVGFDEGYEAAMEEGHMTYALCDNDGCRNHDGDGCTLETASFKADCADAMTCLDYEEAGDDSNGDIR